MLNLKKIIRLLAHMIWPEHCLVCGRAGVSYCDGCLESAVLPLPAFCLDCGGLYGADCCHDTVRCGAAALHDGLARDFLLNLKYHNARSLGIGMGRCMGKLFPKSAYEPDIVVPIPLHKGSPREYNQSEMLARGIAEIWGIPAEYNLLKWHLDIKRQTGRGLRCREAMPRDAMVFSEGLAGKKIFLVDDVYTTGATLRAAGNAVRRSGGVVSGALVWSRRVSSAESAAAWKDVPGEE